MNVAESILLANAVSSGMFNSSILEFATGRFDGKYNIGADGGSRISLPEIMKFGSGASSAYGSHNTLGGAVKFNLERQGAMMAAQLIGIPIAFRIGSKLLKKPRRQANQLLKQIGMTEVKL